MENMNDDNRPAQAPMSDTTQPLSVRKLITSRIIDLDGDIPVPPPEDAVPPDKAYLSTRYKLKLRAMKLSRQSFSPPEATSSTWDFEGSSWTRSDDNGWALPQDTCATDMINLDQSYATYATQTNVCLHACATPTDSQLREPAYLRIQCDSGANANITSNLSALKNVRWIQPTAVASADKESSLIVSSISQLPVVINGTVYDVNCYYSDRSDGTLLSPNAFARQFNDLYFGYRIYSNLDSSRGETVFLGREGIDDLVVTLEMHNLL